MITLQQEYHARRLDILLRVLFIIQQLLQENRHGTKRDIYYLHPSVFRGVRSSRVKYFDIFDPSTKCYYISQILDAGLGYEDVVLDNLTQILNRFHRRIAGVNYSSIYHL